MTTEPSEKTETAAQNRWKMYKGEEFHPRTEIVIVKENTVG